MSTVHQCQNCQPCRGNGGGCILKDNIAPAIYDADGMFKMALDRCYCFLDMNSSTILPKGKKVAVIVTARADQDRADGIAEEPERNMINSSSTSL